MKIIGIHGSTKTSSPSFNKALINAAKDLAPESVEFEAVNIVGLPLYSEELETDYPSDVAAFKQKVAEADAIVIATPEHNRSVPTVLKNAIDWASRPYGQSAWNNKPVLIMGATGGALGTYGAQHHLRDIFAHNQAYVLPEPALHIVFAHDKTADDNVTDQETREHIAAGLKRLVEYTQQLAK